MEAAPCAALPVALSGCWTAAPEYDSVSRVAHSLV
jgi:hypothetical protein